MDKVKQEKFVEAVIKKIEAQNGKTDNLVQLLKKYNVEGTEALEIIKLAQDRIAAKKKPLVEEVKNPPVFKDKIQDKTQIQNSSVEKTNETKDSSVDFQLENEATVRDKALISNDSTQFEIDNKVSTGTTIDDLFAGNKKISKVSEDFLENAQIPGVKTKGKGSKAKLIILILFLVIMGGSYYFITKNPQILEKAKDLPDREKIMGNILNLPSGAEAPVAPILPPAPKEFSAEILKNRVKSLPDEFFPTATKESMTQYVEVIHDDQKEMEQFSKDLDKMEKEFGKQNKLPASVNQNNQ